MSVVHYFASQLREPKGWFGKLFMGRLINRASRRLAENSVRLLDIGPGDKVLEIGFGGGAGLAGALAAASGGKVYGIDISLSMVEQVQGRFRREIEDGRLQVRIGDVSKLPFESETFDRVFAVNNIYFWPDVVACLREIRRVLKDGGKVGIGNRSKEHMSRFQVTQHGFQLFSAEDLEGVLHQAGFRDVSVEHKRAVDSGRFPDQVIGVETK